MYAAVRRLAFLPLVALAACTTKRSADSTSSATPPAAAPATGTPRSWAGTGDTVWVLSNHVKPDKRAQFEEFFDAFWAAGQKPNTLDSATARTFVHTRLLTPTAPDSDGTYTYYIIMDPIIRGANYDLGAAVDRLFPKPEAERLGKLLDSSMARPQEQRVVRQRLPR